jgi:hypothetical protein
MAIKVTSAPSVEPVSLANMKLWLKIETSVTADDDLVTALIKAARITAEEYTGRKFITQTVDYYLDAIPMARSEEWWNGVRDGALVSLDAAQNYFEIPFGPIQSVTSITYYTIDNTANTFSSTNYTSDIYSVPPRICLNSGYSWPSNLRAHNAIKVTVSAGYGSAATSVPDDLITAIKIIVSHWYENRGDSDKKALPPPATVLLNPYCLIGDK